MVSNGIVLDDREKALYGAICNSIAISTIESLGELTDFSDPEKGWCVAQIPISRDINLDDLQSNLMFFVTNSAVENLKFRVAESGHSIQAIAPNQAQLKSDIVDVGKYISTLKTHSELRAEKEKSQPTPPKKTRAEQSAEREAMQAKRGAAQRQKKHKGNLDRLVSRMDNERHKRGGVNWTRRIIETSKNESNAETIR